MQAATLDPSALARMLVVFVHLLCMVAAGIGIAFGDYALFARQRIDAVLLHKAARAVTVALLLLWATGLTLIGMDTGFDLAVLAARPKLVAKLGVVTLLSINGLALHGLAFERLCTPQAHAGRAALLPAMLGAVSLVTWLYAAFLGLAKPCSDWLGLTGFIALYAAALAAGIAAALCFVRPRLARRMAHAA